MARVVIAMLAVALSSVAAGCGGGGSKQEQPEGTPPAQWVTSVCGALDAWQTSLQDKAKGLPRDVLQAASPTAAKQRIDAFLGEVIAQTDTMIRQVDEAGQPAVQQGRRIASNVHARLLRVKAAFVDARKRVASVPTDDPSAFQRQLTEIGQNLLAQGTALGTVLKQADAKPIQDALQNDKRCAAFTG